MLVGKLVYFMRIFHWASKLISPSKFEKIRFGNNEDGGYVQPSMLEVFWCKTYHEPR